MDISGKSDAIYVFFQNGSVYESHASCHDILTCKEEIGKISSYFNKKKNGWGGYWFEGNKIIIQTFFTAAAGMFGGEMHPSESFAFLESDTKFKVVSSKNLYPGNDSPQDYSYQFVHYSPKPDSTHWILEKKWYKKARSKSDNLKK